ncbi:condensation domain-containing protein [Saccharothrix coeruleofusca]|uniref:Condensation domain-containing protein n=1 Tax=Saccharothrix coeruleofusca TaxID=33919 RepID=A0A918ALF4_9PSEU|nr:condensation domain-containing protein [Saccharothrix coeruleofusca]GGP55815.1 hypothetical protein GCM10010185_30480 [Saccharothrix coeruleofusca]
MNVSPAQHRLWFLQQLDPGATEYNGCVAYELRGALDRRALRLAVSDLVDRHEALRTSFPAQRGVPRMDIAPPGGGVDIPVVDISDAEAALFVEERISTPFELAAGPPIRIWLLCLDRDRHVLVIVVHHILIDAWSIEIMAEELKVLYTAHSSGTPVRLPAPEAQYSDFAAWQRATLTREHVERELSFWRERLDGAPALLDLIADRPHQVDSSAAGEELLRPIPPDLVEQVRSLAARYRRTMFVTALTALTALLSHVSGTDDIVLTVPVSGRSRAEFQSTVGFFVNTVPLRMDIPRGLPFDRIAERVSAATFDAMEHSSVPFDVLVSESRDRRGEGSTPLADIAFQLLHTGAGRTRWGGLEVAEWGGARQAVTRFALELHVLDRAPRAMDQALCYRTDRLLPGTARRLLDGYEGVLWAAAADPGAPLSELGSRAW